MSSTQVDYPGGFMLPLPSGPSETDKDTLKPVRVATPLPDLLPRNLDEIKRMRDAHRDASVAKKCVPARRDLPPPYVNDDECDEFEDQTIDTSVLNLPEGNRLLPDGANEPIRFHLAGPSVRGQVSAVFDSGMLYKIVCPDDTWHYYNDTDKYEMHIDFTFGAKSDVEPGERAEVFVRNNNEMAASLIVYPGETVKLLSGKVNGFKCNAKAVPLSDDKRDVLYGEVNDTIAAEMDAMAADMQLSVDALTEEKVLMYCEERGIPYTDCDFRPCDYSLYRPDLDSYMPRFIPWHRPTTWIEASQHGEVRLFRRTVSARQVSHGAMGDTYLISAMAALAEMPRRLHDIFRHPVSALNGKTERALGAYWTMINSNGWWLPVLLDDYLPATRDGPEFARCRHDVRRLWVALLEKMYAKVHGSYANIASGDPLEPLTEWTGFPVSRYTLSPVSATTDSPRHASPSGEDAGGGSKDSMDLFAEMLSAHDKGYLQMLITPSDAVEAAGNARTVSGDPELEARYAAVGLRLHHGYTVLAVRHFPAHGDLRLLQIRNPWPAEPGQRWNGAWNRDDARWSSFPDVREACFPHGMTPSSNRRHTTTAINHTINGNTEDSSCADADDDTFWICWDDALSLFTGGGCCHIRSPWFDYRIRGVFERGVPTVSLEIHVSAPTEAYLMLSQEDERDNASVEYQAILLAVFKNSGKKAKLDATSSTLVERPDRQLRFNFARDVALRYTFVPEHSPYYVIPRMHDTTVERTPYVLGCLPDTYVGNGILVEFKKVDRNCKVFSNMPSFAPQGMVDDVAAEYQIRNPRQPTEHVGMEIQDERLEEFGVTEF